MTDLAASEKNPWHTIHTFLTRKITILQIMANLAGAGIVTSYFLFFDTNLKVQRVTNDLIVIGIMFAGLDIIAVVFLNRWQKDLNLSVPVCRDRSFWRSAHRPGFPAWHASA